MNKAIIVDLDETLALLNGRNPYDASTADKDKPNEIVIEVVKFFASKDYKVILLTGRKEQDRSITEKWIKQYSIPHDELIMREDDDKRSAPELKKDELLSLLDKYDVKLALDDMYKNCEMFRSFDIPAWQVAADPYKKSEIKDHAILDKIGLGGLFDTHGKNPDEEEAGVVHHSKQ